MEGETASKASSRPSKRRQQKKRFWTVPEEEVLLEAIREITKEGWKVENGFKTGYCLAIEKSIRKALPETDIKADPHISSKIHVWKKHWSALSTMLNTSGFGWNSAAHMIVVEDENVWANHAKKDPVARGMRYKPWPLYGAWCEIFGRDRATGEGGEDACDAETNMGRERVRQRQALSEENQGDVQSTPLDEDLDVQSTAPIGTKQTASSRKSRRKQRSDAGDESLKELFGNFTDRASSRLETIATESELEVKKAQARHSLCENLKSFNWLSVGDRVFVSRELGNNPNLLDIFSGMDDEEKTELLKQLLENRPMYGGT